MQVKMTNPYILMIFIAHLRVRSKNTQEEHAHGGHTVGGWETYGCEGAAGGDREWRLCQGAAAPFSPDSAVQF